MSDEPSTPKRTAATAELDANSNTKRASATDLLAMLSPAQHCDIMRASGQSLALRAADAISGATMSAYIRDMPLAEQATMIATLASVADNCGLVSTLLTALSSNELWLHPLGTDLLVFALLDSPCSDGCRVALEAVVDLAVLNAKSPQTGDTLLHRAVAQQDCSFVARLLACGVSVQRNNRGHIPLYSSIIDTSDTDPEKLEPIIVAFNCARQLQHGLFYPNDVVDGKTFLGLLCSMPYPKLVETWLIAMDSDCMVAPGQKIDESRLPHGKTYETYSRWRHSLVDEPEDQFAYFVAHGMQMPCVDDIIYDAIDRGRVDIIRELVRQKSIVDMMRLTDDRKMVAPLEYLCNSRVNHTHTKEVIIEIATLIVDNPLLQCYTGETRHHILSAINKNLVHIVKLMIDRGVDVSKLYKRRSGDADITTLYAAITVASEMENDEMISLLIEHGALANIPERLSHPFVHASGLARVEPLKLILNGLGGSVPAEVLDNALVFACNRARIDSVRLLLNLGAKCSTQALMTATLSRNREIASLILDRMHRSPVDEYMDVVALVVKQLSRKAGPPLPPSKP